MMEMIDVTPEAAARIRTLLDQNQCPGGLRLGVVGGGCSGLSYKFKLEPKPKPTDNVFEYSGVQVFVDPKSYEYLKGLTLDYTESLMENSFVFRNPNAKRHCSCGKSFLT
jgi:iron-sulfur cluster assembly protein